MSTAYIFPITIIKKDLELKTKSEVQTSIKSNNKNNQIMK